MKHHCTYDKKYFYKRERDIIYWGCIHFVDWSVIKLSEFYIWRTALWTLGSRVIYQERASQLTVTISQDPTWNIIVHMTKIYFYKRERDIIYWGWIHFVDWSVIKLSEFHIWHSALWPLCSRVIYQEMVYALMTTPSNSPALGWGSDIITIFLELQKQYIRSCRYDISLVFAVCICFIILSVRITIMRPRLMLAAATEYL